MTSICKKLTIFEGCDGSGKTTAARRFAEYTDARYVHCGPFPNVTTGLARLYVEAMLPALLGYQDVVLDRCWLSEAPYGMVYRDGQDRLGLETIRMLERIAFRCSTVVVWCDPGYSTIRENYMKRRHLEMLKDETQLHGVYEGYERQASSLPAVCYNYRTPDKINFTEENLAHRRSLPHPVDCLSAGSMAAKVVLVGDSFAEHKNDDPLYQLPFISFSNWGCSRWLTTELEFGGVNEYGLLWVNADHLEKLGEVYAFDDTVKLICLGDKAYAECHRIGLQPVKVPHPQHWKRFHNGVPYPIFNHIF